MVRIFPYSDTFHAVYDVLCDLVSFVQCKKNRENTHGGKTPMQAVGMIFQGFY